MDRRLKERLIGASILVVLAVLFVPELLSGPSRPRAPPVTNRESVPVRTYTLEVGSAASLAPQTTAPANPTPAPGAALGTAPSVGQGIQLAAAPHESSAADAGQAAHSPATPPAADAGGTPEIPPDTPDRSDRDASQSAAAPTAVARNAGRPGSWSIQLGSFSSAGNAEHLLRDLRSQGFRAYISSVGKGSRARHRVRVGPFAERSAAERTIAPLRAHGHSGAIVAP